MFTPRSNKSLAEDSFAIEKLAFFSALFFIAFGVGLMIDGKKLYAHQLKFSQHVDYKSTLNPYQY